MLQSRSCCSARCASISATSTLKAESSLRLPASKVCDETPRSKELGVDNLTFANPCHEVLPFFPTLQKDQISLASSHVTLTSVAAYKQQCRAVEVDVTKFPSDCLMGIK